MTPKIDKEQWTAIMDKTYEVEFDWLGVDKLGQIAMFSSFNKGFIPNLITKSFDKYQQLDITIDSLKIITQAILYTKRKGKFQDWILYSQKGFFAYDYQDAHRDTKLGQYDLISKPANPLTINKTFALAAFNDIIPKFDIIFNTDIAFQTLRKTEIKNGM